ncbi:hypothetical protein CBS147346_3730 [Aspergillus niger]|nr:hypothetical protein CBS147346_3730 [Aspergillus niger]
MRAATGTGHATSKDDDRKTSTNRLKNAEKSQNGKPKDDKSNRGREEFRKLINFYHQVIVDRLFDEDFDDLEKSPYLEASLQADRSGSTLLHSLVSQMGEEERVLSEEALDYIQRTVLENPRVFTSENNYNATPIIEAAKAHTYILFLVLDLLLSEPTRAELRSHPKSCDGDEICSLRDVDVPDAIRLHLSRQSNKQNECPPTPPPDSEPHVTGWVCPYLNVDIDQELEEDQKLRDALIAALAPVGQSQKLFEGLITVRNFDITGKHIDLEAIKVLLDLIPEEVFLGQSTDDYTPVQRAVLLIDKESLDLTTLFGFIQLLVDHCPASVFRQSMVNGVEKSLFQLLKEKTTKLAQKEASTKQALQLEVFLKSRCIGYGVSKQLTGEHEGSHSYGWEDKRDLLYPDITSARRIFLNLTGETKRLDEKYISNVKNKSGVRFEKVLGFVQLPYWDTPTEPTLAAENMHNKSDGRIQASADPYIGIFRWLREEGVEKIFKVEVNDDGDQPHTNAAIRECLTDKDQDGRPAHFDIEVWKWKKFDICSDTIVRVAPGAKEVHLYSLGNTAILRSWASKTGIARLEKLESLVVEIYPKCYNDERDCREYQEEFENRLLKRCTHLKTLKVDVIPFDETFRVTSKKAGITTANGPENRLGTGHTMPKSGEWIEELSGYTGFMAQINSHLEGKLKVKVAILDDGVNLDEIEEDNQQGESFSPTQEYWVGDCKHGTAMAKCVRQICPSAELIIARLDDSRSNDSQHPFTIRSCTQALRYALRMGADIISMSWSFAREQDSVDNDKAEFENLVSETLRNDKAILFGSHPDKGVNHEISRFAPVGLDNVIKICSATDYGAITQENLHTRPDFLLPGENVEGVWNGVRTVRGSSFATAYAAGLAALVLYTLQANMIFSEEDAEDDFEESKLALEIVKRHQGMRKVFRILAKKDVEDITARNCFVRPNSELKVDDTFDVDLKKHLRKVVSQIVPQKVLKAKFS